MKKVAIILADGFEEIEAVSVMDILRRAGIEALGVGLQNLEVNGAHNIQIKADLILDDIKVDEFVAIVLPGGLPGAKYLANSQKLGEILREFNLKNLKIAAICAAPWALSTANVLKNSYTCYPGFEKNIDHSGYEDNKNVVIDQNIITSKGPATAMEFALNLVKEICSYEKYMEIKKDLLFVD
ncbi:DJ-1/PfpI family protein [Campylobacter sp. FMV-PI01]|uniref:DJ-1/PfpI family protein n=1 Tax=Campylobacter portucalensis TaxID=2608384 RepID=A0A6L5WJB5_9BACT|nr:DJ-1 family glyoxalase III [Campylobacter portucalensis]MSN96552.1 DJ-1/PfpI family protein [Campylobacter portucalensis]